MEKGQAKSLLESTRLAGQGSLLVALKEETPAGLERLSYWTATVTHSRVRCCKGVGNLSPAHLHSWMELHPKMWPFDGSEPYTTVQGLPTASSLNSPQDDERNMSRKCYRK